MMLSCAFLLSACGEQSDKCYYIVKGILENANIVISPADGGIDEKGEYAKKDTEVAVSITLEDCIIGTKVLLSEVVVKQPKGIFDSN